MTALESAEEKLNEYDKNIGSLTLTYLGLTDSDLKQLMPKIKKIQNLRILRLSGNQLTTLPSEIVGIKTLRELSLTNNKIEVLPPK